MTHHCIDLDPETLSKSLLVSFFVGSNPLNSLTSFGYSVFMIWNQGSSSTAKTQPLRVKFLPKVLNMFFFSCKFHELNDFVSSKVKSNTRSVASRVFFHFKSIESLFFVRFTMLACISFFFSVYSDLLNVSSIRKFIRFFCLRSSCTIELTIEL